MKGLFVFLTLAILGLVFTIPTQAQEPVTLKFAFTQENDGVVDGWHLYMADAEAGPYTKALDASGEEWTMLKENAVFNTDTGEWVTEKPFEVRGEANTVIIKYFKMTAFGTSALDQSKVESGMSNSVSHAFYIPISMSVPVLIRVEEK